MPIAKFFLKLECLIQLEMIHIVTYHQAERCFNKNEENSKNWLLESLEFLSVPVMACLLKSSLSGSYEAFGTNSD